MTTTPTQWAKGRTEAKPPATGRAAPAGGHGTTHVRSLDVWRGTAVLLLLIGHFFPARFIEWGRVGVELFFVLSGFLMGGVLFVKQTPLPRFYVRRVSRIVPTAFCFLIAMLACRWAGIFGTSERLKYGGVAAAFTFFTNYYLAFVDSAGPGIPVTHFWSLSVEEHAYVLLSLVALAHRRRRAPLFIVIATLALLCWANGVRLMCQTPWSERYLLNWRSDVRVFSIFAGTLVAIAVSRKWWATQSRIAGVPASWIGTSLLLLGVALNVEAVPDAIKYAGGTTAMALGLGLVSKHAHTGLWNSRCIAWFGILSFSIYVWQQPLYRLVEHGKLSAPIALAAAFIPAVACFYLIENPARRAINNWWDRRYSRFAD